MIRAFGTPLDARDVTVVGAGPVGIALALALADAGVRVLLIEAGTPGREDPRDSAGHIVDERRHAPTAVAMRRGIGGTSRWWGGRCVAYDDADFDDRPHLQASWPIDHDTIRRHYPAAAEFFGVGSIVAEPPVALGDALFGTREHWAPQIDMGERHRGRLEQDDRILVLTGAAVTGLELGEGGSRVDAIQLADDTRRERLPVRRLVLACGGLETVRLLLATQRAHPDAFGGIDGPLGRCYMGHLSGKIADLVLADPSSAAAHDFFVDQGAWRRRRFSLSRAAQRREPLPNIAFWADNPGFGDPVHGNALLSLVWLALAIPPLGRVLVSEGVRRSHVGPRPWRLGRHVANIVAGAPLALAQLTQVIRARYLAQLRKPGFLLRSRAGRYALHYHAEQLPRPDSRLRLAETVDRFGTPWLSVDLRFCEEDARGVVRAHELLDAGLRGAGVGRLEYRAPPEERVASVLDQAADGFHQIGGACMGGDPAHSVVDADARVHGVANLHLAGSAIFPTSGQANPTFLAVALALRLAEQIGKDIRQ